MRITRPIETRPCRFTPIACFSHSHRQGHFVRGRRGQERRETVTKYTYHLAEEVGPCHFASAGMRAEDGEYYRVGRQDEAGFPVWDTGHRVTLGYWPEAGRAVVCEGDKATCWMDASSAIDALRKWTESVGANMDPWAELAAWRRRHDQ